MGLPGDLTGGPIPPKLQGPPSGETGGPVTAELQVDRQPPGEKITGKRVRLSFYVVASYSVYAFFALLLGIAVWAWYRYINDEFSPTDTAFLAAEATLLLAAAAILVIVFEIEKAAKARTRPARLRVGVGRGKKPKAD